MPTIVRDAERVRQVLSSGQLTSTDPETGYHRSLYAACPADGGAAAPRRIVRGPQGGIDEVVMRCPQCGGEFVAAIETMYLQ